MKLKKGKIFGILTAITMLSSATAFADSPQSRTAASWQANLPARNGNVYMATKYKDTNLNAGNVYLTSLIGSPGINAWFNAGSSGEPKICSNIVAATIKNTHYTIKYTYNNSVGSGVFLGVEDRESTTVGLNYAEGTVDYK